MRRACGIILVRRMHMSRDIDELISELQRVYPQTGVEQLQVKHPGADDDGLWFFRHPGSHHEVQVESSTGALPFLIEANDHPAAIAESVSEAVSLVAARLGLKGGGTA
jgi:hypothetical protein